QEAVNTHIRSIFGIETGFTGSFIAGVAQKLDLIDMKEVTEETNDMHLAPWAELLKKENIKNSPLTPYLDQELLYNNALSLDGSQICVSTGFTYEHPKLTTESLREVITDFQELGIWPKESN
ncbi:hypothetical protein BGZ46_004666, partial [Entomortierella lignicola]